MWNLSTVQCYLNTPYYRQEITLEEKNALRPKSSQVKGAHTLPKIHKNYGHLQPFCLIINTTNTAHYGIPKYLSNSVHPLTEN